MRTICLMSVNALMFRGAGALIGRQNEKFHQDCLVSCFLVSEARPERSRSRDVGLSLGLRRSACQGRNREYRDRPGFSGRFQIRTRTRAFRKHSIIKRSRNIPRRRSDEGKQIGALRIEPHRANG